VVIRSYYPSPERGRSTLSAAAATHSEPAKWIHLNPLATPEPEEQDDYVILMGDGPPSRRKVTSPRAERRRLMRRRLRGVRPGDPIAVKTTPWYRRNKRETPVHPRYCRTRLVLVPDESGKLVTDVARACPKPAPNRRRAACPAIDDEAFKVVAAATMLRHPEDELEDALARREMSSTEQALAFHLDALEASGIVPIIDGLPPRTHRVLVLQ